MNDRDDIIRVLDDAGRPLLPSQILRGVGKLRVNNSPVLPFDPDAVNTAIWKLVENRELIWHANRTMSVNSEAR